jgi:hypothetical protein
LIASDDNFFRDCEMSEAAHTFCIGEPNDRPPKWTCKGCKSINLAFIRSANAAADTAIANNTTTASTTNNKTKKADGRSGPTSVPLSRTAGTSTKKTLPNMSVTAVTTPSNVSVTAGTTLPDGSVDEGPGSRCPLACLQMPKSWRPSPENNKKSNNRRASGLLQATNKQGGNKENVEKAKIDFAYGSGMEGGGGEAKRGQKEVEGGGEGVTVDKKKKKKLMKNRGMVQTTCVVPDDLLV